MTACPFLKSRDIFGEPGTGVHAWKFKNTSLVDYFLTIFLAFVITAVSGAPLVLTTIGAFVVGIIFHVLFGVNTQTVKALKLTCDE